MSAVETVQHIGQCGLHDITGVHHRPADSDVLGRVIWVRSEPQGGFVEGVTGLPSDITPLEPSLVGGVELLL